MSTRESRKFTDREFIVAHTASGGNQRKMAAALGCAPGTLYYHAMKLGKPLHFNGRGAKPATKAAKKAKEAKKPRTHAWTTRSLKERKVFNLTSFRKAARETGYDRIKMAKKLGIATNSVARYAVKFGVKLRSRRGVRKVIRAVSVRKAKRGPKVKHSGEDIKRLFSQVNFNYGRLGSKLGVTRQRAYQLVQQHLRASA